MGNEHSGCYIASEEKSSRHIILVFNNQFSLLRTKQVAFRVTMSAMELTEELSSEINEERETIHPELLEIRDSFIGLETRDKGIVHRRGVTQ